jgi:hypothetical protein
VVAYKQKGVSFNHEEEWNPGVYRKMTGNGDHVTQSKPNSER